MLYRSSKRLHMKRWKSEMLQNYLENTWLDGRNAANSVQIRGWTSEMLQIACKTEGLGHHLGDHTIGGGGSRTPTGTIYVYMYIYPLSTHQIITSQRCWTRHSTKNVSIPTKQKKQKTALPPRVHADQAVSQWLKDEVAPTPSWDA